MPSVKWRRFCLGLSVLRPGSNVQTVYKYFQMRFLGRKYWYFYSHFTAVCSLNWRYGCICLDHGDNPSLIDWQTTFSNAFSWLKVIHKFRFKFRWNLFPVQLTKTSIGSGIGLAPSRRQAIIWNNGPVHWCIHAALRVNEF